MTEFQNLMDNLQNLMSDEKLYLLERQFIGIIEPCMQPGYFFVTVIEDNIAEGLTRGIIKSDILNVLKILRFDYFNCKVIKKEKCSPQPKNVYMAKSFNRPKKRKYELYVIQAKCEGNPIKVGVSECPQARMEQFQTGCPFKLEIIGIVKNVNMNYETQIHKKLSKFKLHGEWFKKEALSVLKKAILEEKNGHYYIKEEE